MPNRDGEKDTKILCLVCRKGTITERWYTAYDPSTGPRIIGPGGRNQYRTHTKFFCGLCGVSYVFLPKEEVRV